MEIKEIFVKNFRNIGENGATIKLSPITIFTGCNSAGKSTAAKAMLLLDTYLSDIKANKFNLIETPMDFAKVGKLGSFDSVLNKAARANGQNEFTLGYSFASAISAEDIQVRLTFGKKESDALNNGWLIELSILTDSTELLSIRIKDEFYVLDIQDKTKFIEYSRSYKISQIGYLWDETQYNEQWEKNSLDLTDSERAKRMEMRSLMPDILAVRNELITDGLIRRNSPLTYAEIDNTMRESLNLSLIIEAIEGCLFFDDLDTCIYNVEKRKGTRLSNEDIDFVLENGTNLTKMKNAIANTLDTQRKEIYLEYYQGEKNRCENYINSYISSEYPTISEFIKATKDQTAITDFEEHFNHTKAQGLCLPGCQRQHLLPIISNQNTKSITLPLIYIIELALNNFCGKVGYVDAATVEVKRLYTLDSTDSFGNLWKHFNTLKSKSLEATHTRFKCGDFMRKWLQELQICNDIIIDNIEGSLLIKLISDDAPEGRSLADYGYGVTQLIELLLHIEIAISNVREGFLHPVCYEIEETATIPYRLIIEEPEVHLHPSLQSRLADLLLDASKHGVEFIIETHSEYLVRRTQVLVSMMNLTEDNIDDRNIFRVYYFPNDGTLFDMQYQANGYFKEAFGSGFLDEAGKWTRELICTNRR